MSNKIEYYLNEIGSRFSGMNASNAVASERNGVVIVNEGNPNLKVVAQQTQMAINANEKLVEEAGAANQEFAEYLRAGTFTEGTVPGPTPEPPPYTYPEPSQVQVVPFGWGTSYRGNVSTQVINAFQFVAQKSGVVDLVVSQYQTDAVVMQAKLSELAGDLTPYQQGNSASGSFNVVAGKTYYFNFKFWSSDIGPSAKGPVASVAVEGNWPV